MNEKNRDLLTKYEVRKTKAQKDEFIKYALQRATGEGYAASVEESKRGSRNIVIGDPDNAKVIFTAHYDTCPVMPFPNFLTPKNIFIYLLYQFLIVGLLLVIPITLMVVITNAGYADIGYFTFLFTYFGALAFMLYGPANKHTANDNTSGVATVFEIMCDMPCELRSKAAFVLFDLEERGLIGSSEFRKKHKEMTNTTPIINFDCVSDGKNILLVGKKTTKELQDLLSSSFLSNENFTVEYEDKWIVYPSDQRNFPRGIGVAAFKKTKNGLLYIDKIHTKNDTVFDEENIDFLKNCALSLTEAI